MVPDRRVLIVEDEAVIALDVEAELKAHGWQIVGVVHSSERALDILKTEKIDAAVLDINLKNDTSYSFADICSTMDIAVVFLSGDDGRSRPQSLMDVPLVTKPLDYAELHAALATVVRRDI
ncbi:response regulator [Aliiroseovarius sp. YM-037]|uniref:response regulator n=1 Tax=Aliiroseovarius sp. YM-037 TaxID=3341728 RepID=UPI003A7FF5ED